MTLKLSETVKLVAVKSAGLKGVPDTRQAAVPVKAYCPLSFGEAAFAAPTHASAAIEIVTRNARFILSPPMIYIIAQRIRNATRMDYRHAEGRKSILKIPGYKRTRTRQLP
jgi:hypothetical protein